jgi:hypothetical protein
LYQAEPAKEKKSTSKMAPSEQKHHFIPRFILRKFVPEDQPPAAPAAPIDKGRSPPRKQRRDFLVNKIDLERSVLTQRPVSTEFALVNMYRDPGFDENPYHLEKKLANLEGQVSSIVQRACGRFSQNLTLELDRTELDRLRKFLFLMKYRNSGMFDRYNHDNVDQYQADDRERMMSYMEASGFRKPRDVWFDNLRRFLDVEMDPARSWMRTLKAQMYPDDAMMMEIHIIWSFIAFCKPASSVDEFLLTQNAYCIFEGPSTIRMDPTTQQVKSHSYTEYHNFAPLSPRLIIILRSHLLPSQGPDNEALREFRNQFAMFTQSQHLHPEKAKSILQDLPIQPCHTSYTAPDMRSSKSLRTSFRKTDKFEFQCFKISSRHTTLINNIFLEEAHVTSSVVYHSRGSLKASLVNYFKEATDGMKTIFKPFDRRSLYLNALEKILHGLESSVSCRKTIFTPKNILNYRVHMSLFVALEVAVELLQSEEVETLLPLPYLTLKPGMLHTQRILSPPINDFDVQERANKLSGTMLNKLVC